MPIYEFACRSCDARFEELVRANGAAPAACCPDCGSADTIRLLSVFAVRTTASGDREQTAVGSQRNGGCCGGSCGCG